MHIYDFIILTRHRTARLHGPRLLGRGSLRRRRRAFVTKDDPHLLWLALNGPKAGHIDMMTHSFGVVSVKAKVSVVHGHERHLPRLQHAIDAGHGELALHGSKLRLQPSDLRVGCQQLLAIRLRRLGCLASDSLRSPGALLGLFQLARHVRLLLSELDAHILFEQKLLLELFHEQALGLLSVQLLKDPATLLLKKFVTVIEGTERMLQRDSLPPVILRPRLGLRADPGLRRLLALSLAGRLLLLPRRGQLGLGS